MKRIILIAPIYYDYHEIIIHQLKDSGYLVDFIEDKNSGFLYTFSTKVNFLLKIYKERYKTEIIEKLNEHTYDYMIVIGGKTLDPDFWEYVSLNYSFRKILYQWDSLRNFNYRSMIPFFDSVKTFDSYDAQTLNIPYLPLFYKKKDNIDINEDLDLLFIGIWHSDRIEILNKIAEYADTKGLRYSFKVYYSWYIYFYLAYIKKTLKPSKFFIFKSIPFLEVISLYRRAKCIIDINHPWQSGLTMRTIETIGEGKKLITTNANIKNEPFYNDKMIRIIDRKKVLIDDRFFNTKDNYKNIEGLEISNWIIKVLDN